MKSGTKATKPAQAGDAGEADHGLPFGVRYAETGSAFSVEVERETDRVWVRLEHPVSREVRVAELVAGESGESGDDGVCVWRGEAEGDLRGWSYVYELERGGRRFGGIVDPWATLVRGGRGIIEREDSDVVARPPLSPKDAVIYELHIRDFTRDRSSGVGEDGAGRYLGLVQGGTVLSGRDDGLSLSTGLDHLLELGVNVVQVMPVHSFSLPYHPGYEWGYMPNDFNAPHAGYARGVDSEAPLREFKQMVSGLHQAGLRVTLDVVYNHTAEYYPSKLRSMMALAPRSYYRFRPDGSAFNGSGCGNEFASETVLGRRFLRESVKYWVRRFGIDGYRFDLMGLVDAESMRLVAEDLHAMDESLLVYGEPWAGGEAGIPVNSKGNQRGKGWGVFNDDMRDGLRGRVFEVADTGFLNGGGGREGVKQGVKGAVGTFAEQPTETINYAECHDNHTLMDRFIVTADEIEWASIGAAWARESMSMLAGLILLTSQGLPFIHSGQEFGRTKEQEDNTYNLGDHVNNIVWDTKAQNHRLFRQFREMVRVRLEHPMFRLGERELVERAVKMLDDDLGVGLPGGTIGYLIEDVTGDDSWEAALVLCNGTGEPVEMPVVPFGEGKGAVGWTCAMVEGRLDRAMNAKPWRVSGKRVEVPAFSGLLLYRERAAVRS